MGTELKRALNDAVVRRLAGERSYLRGDDYYQHGHVSSLEDDEGGVCAVVRGNQDYTVRLSSNDGVLDYACDCPHGADGAFCKHCVAAALAWLNRGAAPAKSKARMKAQKVTLADAEKMLRDEDKDALIRMILDWAKDDDRLHERLLMYAARRSGPESGKTAALQVFGRAVRVRGGFIDYREAPRWAQGVDEAIDNIEQLLEDGQAAATIEVCESALQKLVTAAGAMDDSDGYLSMLRDRLEDIHFRACEEARPDPVELARRLFDWELHSELDVFYAASDDYADVLGASGLTEYRRLAEAEWKKVPARTAKEQHSDSGRYFRITSIMESLAKASGDVEELVSVMSRDLSHAYDYLKIAEAYREAGRHDQALLWAEKGLKAFPERTDERLREFAADEYHRRQRHDDAMQLMWAEFYERPYLGTYQKLQGHAKKAGTWTEWRERALAEIRGRIAKAKEEFRGETRFRWMRPAGDRSLLVEIFVYEHDEEAAWREAQEGGCSDHLWLRLAAAREEEHPADAAPIYLRQAEERVRIGGGRYEDSVNLLVKAAALMKRMERSEEFVRHLNALLVKYKIKRNFIKQVEQKRKLLYLY